MKHTISIVLHNESDTLVRGVGLFAARRGNHVMLADDAPASILAP